jgi:glycerol uptake facilitator-like aquaporin
VYGTAIDSRAPKVGGLFIGLTITISILCFGPITGSAINPARFLGPAIIEHHFDNVGLYILGPLVGGGLAGLLYHYFYGKEGMTPAPLDKPSESLVGQGNIG